MNLAYAVLHTDPPAIYAAEDIDVLHRVIALEVVAKTSAAAFPPPIRAQIREALLEERWGLATELWMIHYSNAYLDVYPSGLEVWTDQMIAADVTKLELQFTPLFQDETDDATAH